MLFLLAPSIAFMIFFLHTFEVNFMLIESTVDVRKDALGDGFAGGQIVIAVGKDFRFHDRYQSGRLADGSVSTEWE